METVAILGAGDLGATLARKLAERQLARRVILVDADEGKAKGKALDILQSGPVEGYDTRVVGAATVEGVVDALVVADPAERPAAKGLAAGVGKGLLLVAGSQAPGLLEAAVKAGVPRNRALGSAPVAYAGAVRRRLAGAVQAEPDAITIALLGLPPEHVIVPVASAAVGGVAVDTLAATALRRALEAVRRRVPGPVALAAAAGRTLQAVFASRGAVLPVFAFLDGEYGHRGIVLAVPARLGEGGLLSVLEFLLDPVDRVAFDTAAQRRYEGED